MAKITLFQNYVIYIYTGICLESEKKKKKKKSIGIVL
jgi:hypothetical protein